MALLKTSSYSLDDPIVRLPCYEPNSHSLELTGRDLCAHTILTGSTGSGKTSILNHFIRDIIRFRADDPCGKIGMLVIDAKSDDTTSKVCHWAAEAGRQEDVVVIDGAQQGFTVIDQVKTPTDVEDVFGLLQAVTLDDNIGGDNAYWDQTSHAQLEAICKACYLDPDSPGLTIESLITMIQLWSIQRGKGNFMRLLNHIKAHLTNASRVLSHHDRIYIENLIATMENWQNLDHRTASILTSIFDHTSNPLAKALSFGYFQVGKKGFHFRDIFVQGKIAVLKLDCLVRPEIAKTVGRLAKSMFYLEAQKRAGGEHSDERLVGVIADEYPLIATGGDRRFSDIPQLQTLRSKRTFFVAASQGLSSIQRTIGSADTKAMALNFNNLFFFNSTEAAVEEWARKRLGQAITESSMDIQSSSESPDGDLQEADRRSRHRFRQEGWVLPIGGLGRLETHQAYVSTRGNANEHKLLWFAPLFPPANLKNTTPPPALANLREILISAAPEKEAEKPAVSEEEKREERHKRLSESTRKIMSYAGYFAWEDPEEVECLASALVVQDSDSVSLFNHLYSEPCYQISGGDQSELPDAWKVALFKLLDCNAIRSGRAPILNTFCIRDGLCLIDYLADEDWELELERIDNGQPLSELGQSLVRLQISLYPTVFRPLKRNHRYALNFILGSHASTETTFAPTANPPSERKPMTLCTPTPEKSVSTASSSALLTIHFDGSRQADGTLSYGVVAWEGERQLLTEARKVRDWKGLLKTGTSNEAELYALLAALNLAKQIIKGENFSFRHVEIKGDSELVIDYMTGQKLVRSKRLRPLVDKARKMCDHVPMSVKFKHIPRHENKVADSLARNLR